MFTFYNGTYKSGQVCNDNDVRACVHVVFACKFYDVLSQCTKSSSLSALIHIYAAKRRNLLN